MLTKLKSYFIKFAAVKKFRNLFYKVSNCRASIRRRLAFFFFVCKKKIFTRFKLYFNVGLVSENLLPITKFYFQVIKRTLRAALSVLILHAFDCIVFNYKFSKIICDVLSIPYNMLDIVWQWASLLWFVFVSVVYFLPQTYFCFLSYFETEKLTVEDQLNGMVAEMRFLFDKQKIYLTNCNYKKSLFNYLALKKFYGVYCNFVIKIFNHSVSDYFSIGKSRLVVIVWAFFNFSLVTFLLLVASAKNCVFKGVFVYFLPPMVLFFLAELLFFLICFKKNYELRKLAKVYIAHGGNFYKGIQRASSFFDVEALDVFLLVVKGNSIVYCCGSDFYQENASTSAIKDNFFFFAFKCSLIITFLKKNVIAVFHKMINSKAIWKSAVCVKKLIITFFNLTPLKFALFLYFRISKTLKPFFKIMPNLVYTLFLVMFVITLIVFCYKFFTGGLIGHEDTLLADYLTGSERCAADNFQGRAQKK